MVQPYIKGVDTRGETALIYFGGEFSHAIHKGSMLGGAPASTSASSHQESIAPREPTPAERAVGDRVMAHVRERFGVLAYARVDLLAGAGGAPRPGGRAGGALAVPDERAGGRRAAGPGARGAGAGSRGWLKEGEQAAASLRDRLSARHRSTTLPLRFSSRPAMNR